MSNEGVRISIGIFWHKAQSLGIRHSVPCALRPVPCALCPAPCALRPAPCALCPVLIFPVLLVHLFCQSFKYLFFKVWRNRDFCSVFKYKISAVFSYIFINEIYINQV